MKILPQKYDELSIEKYDKQLMALLKSIYRDDDAIFLLCCNPTKTMDGVVHILIEPKGVIMINVKPAVVDSAALITALFSRMVANKDEMEILTDRFSHQRNLVKNGKIVFPFSIVNFFPEADKPDFSSTPGMEMLENFVEESCLFNDFWKRVRKSRQLLSDICFGTDAKNVIGNDLVPDIINRVAPEYTIPQIKAAVDEKKMDKRKIQYISDSKLGVAERAAVAYMLDETQIDYINKIKKGDQLIVACAGSGKSVILISKCFKVAGLNPDKRFLITGYNRNLVSYFRWLIDSAGFSTNNVECLTYDRLCVKLLQENGLKVPNALGGDYTKVRDAFIQNVNIGRIKSRYYGVFIDEVQMFEPEWYKSCYQLVENKKTDEHFFVICGDKSQSVKKSIKSGRAPWQGHGDDYPNFRGKSFPIEINYRNSIQINSFIRRFTDHALKFAERLNIPVNQDADIFLRGKSIREGLDLQFIEVNQAYNDSDAEAITVLNQIIDIHDNYHIPYDSIAVICYNRGYRYVKNREEKHYAPIDKLKDYLNTANIPYSLLNSSGSEYSVSYSDIDGVPIVTMESSLGLDFRAVIICGLLPLGLHDHTKDLNMLKTYYDKEEIVNAFNKNINILYMSCARAKDILRIVSAETSEQSVYVNLLKEAFVGRD
ncbi:hypothetical protein SAMN06296386_11510 [Lachnospiraceae bacterium]|nr:hypothetical protein SAMN06296386_11510 [Lachnospiraceae bacterium]